MDETRNGQKSRTIKNFELLESPSKSTPRYKVPRISSHLDLTIYNRPFIAWNFCEYNNQVWNLIFWPNFTRKHNFIKKNWFEPFITINPSSLSWNIRKPINVLKYAIEVNRIDALILKIISSRIRSILWSVFVRVFILFGPENYESYNGNQMHEKKKLWLQTHFGTMV